MSKKILLTSKKTISLLLTMLMVFSLVPMSLLQTVNAAETKSDPVSAASVSIESFVRGKQSDLRCSELLIARVTGLDDSIDPSTLYYKWTNKLCTYLYVYNTHNMFDVDVHSTEHEHEISFSTSTRTNPTYTAQGFQYAAVYGANAYYKDSSKYNLNGGFQVDVYQGDPSKSGSKLIGTATYGNTTSKSKKVIQDANLTKDLQSTVLGMFEGETVEAKNLFGEAGIVHITCPNCTVTKATSEDTSTARVSDTTVAGDYTVTGVKVGMTYLDVSVTKGSCKFHYQSSGSAKVPVYVFEKPVSETSATTLTLYDKLHITPGDTYNYYIIKENGERVKGIPQDGKITWTGLNENTNYQILIEAPYTEGDITHYAYGWINDTTKHLADVTVNVKLDGIAANGSAIGATDELHFKGVYSGSDYTMTNTKTGTYTAHIGPGTYQICDKDGNPVNDQKYVVDDNGRTIVLNYYSVTYTSSITAQNMPSPLKEVYPEGTIVEASKNVPTASGKQFTGWAVDSQTSQTIVQPDGVISISINKPYVLYAQWQDLVDIYVNVEIRHGADNQAGAASDATFRLVGGTLDPAQYEKTIKPSSHAGFDYTTGTYTSEGKTHNKTVYTATTATYAQMPSDIPFGIDTSKGNYSVAIHVDDSELKSNHKLIYNIVYEFNPSYTDYEFKVKLGDNLKALKAAGKADLVPIGAYVKATVYRFALDQDAVGNETQDKTPYWRTILEHADNSVYVPLDENGEGTGTTQVWPFEGLYMDGADGSYQFHFRTKVYAIVYSDGTTVLVDHTGDFDTDNNNVSYMDSNNIYSVDIEVTDGQKPNGPSYDKYNEQLYGVRYVDTNGDKVPEQKGMSTAIIDTNIYNVKFDAVGGKFDDGTNAHTVNNVLTIPQFRTHIPTRDGGYVFRGWYYDEACTVQAVVDTPINTVIADDGNGHVYDKDTKTLTLFAKWDNPVSVHVALDTSYKFTYNGETLVTLVDDRNYNAGVTLQKKLATDSDDAWENCGKEIAEFDLETRNNPASTENYAQCTFTNLPANDANGTKYEYRIVVAHPNGVITYHPQVADFSQNPLVGEAEVSLRFVPKTFTLNVELSNEPIIDRVRPLSAKVVYEFREIGTKNNWQTIVQHLNNDKTGYNPISGNFTNNLVTGSAEAWKYGNVTFGGFEFRPKVIEVTDYNGNVYDMTSADAIYYPFKAVVDSIVDSTTVAEGGTATMYAHLEPNEYNVFLDTADPNATIDLSVEDMPFGEFGQSQLPEGNQGKLYSASLDYGEGLVESDPDNKLPHDYILPTPVSTSGRTFVGWHKVVADDSAKGYTILDEITTEIPYTEQFATKYLIAEWSFAVNFHTNLVDTENDKYDEIFRTYTENDSKIGDYHLTADNKIEAFYDIPEHDNNEVIFAGWYTEPEGGEPIKWNSDVYTTNTDIYAHWITEDKVAQEDDGKLNVSADEYTGFNLLGVQVRSATFDREWYPDESATKPVDYSDSGLRFVTILSESVYDQIQALNTQNNFEYGYLLAKESTAQAYAKAYKFSEMEYKSATVNGKDTSTTQKYVQNVKCNLNGISDHYNGEKYRLYTAVVTYNAYKDNPDALQKAHDQKLLARSYMRYTDANGLDRVCYNDYTGTRVLGGCGSSFTAAEKSIREIAK